MITGSTRLIAIVGTPIAQVSSPAYFNHWFAEHDADLVMIPIELLPDALADFASVMRSWPNLKGCVVTRPHKQAFASLVDTLTPRAKLLNSVNVVRRDPQGSLSGEMVDGIGFLRAARRHDFSAEGCSAAIVGGGAAGSAIAMALCEAGAVRLGLVEHIPARLEALRSLIAKEFPLVKIGGMPASLAEIDLLVNATALGMYPSDEMPVREDLLLTLGATTLVADVITSPSITRLLRRARERGCRIQTGAEMAIAQLELLGFFMNVMHRPQSTSTE